MHLAAKSTQERAAVAGAEKAPGSSQAEGLRPARASEPRRGQRPVTRDGGQGPACRRDETLGRGRTP